MLIKKEDYEYIYGGDKVRVVKVNREDSFYLKGLPVEDFIKYEKNRLGNILIVSHPIHNGFNCETKGKDSYYYASMFIEDEVVLHGLETKIKFFLRKLFDLKAKRRK
jgi:hypothetical protein